MGNLDIFGRLSVIKLGWVWALVGISSGSSGSIVFDEQIQPILEAKCYKCHSSEKQKGELRLDTPAFIRQGGENGNVIVPGDPNESVLYFLTTYLEDDPDFMPQKGEGLTSEEKKLLRLWIAQGANFGDGEWDHATLATNTESLDPEPVFHGTYLIKGAALDVISRLKNQGMLIDTVNHDASQFEIKYTYAKIPAGQFDFNRLQGIETSVSSIDLSRTQITDAELGGLALFENLRSLNLNRTSISDKGLAYLNELKNLEYLNLHGTDISDNGLNFLSELPSLRRLYIWNTNTTKRGVDFLNKKRPDIQIESGGLALPPSRPNRFANN